VFLKCHRKELNVLAEQTESEMDFEIVLATARKEGELKMRIVQGG